MSRRRSAKNQDRYRSLRPVWLPDGAAVPPCLGSEEDPGPCSRPLAYGCGPRSPRCPTHLRAHDKRQRIGRRETAVTTTYGITAEEQRELWEFQGKLCGGCRRRPRMNPDTDHDHKCCNGPKSCGKCVRGMLCRECNVILGHYNEQMLLGLAAYIHDPPMARLRRSRNPFL